MLVWFAKLAVQAFECNDSALSTESPDRQDLWQDLAGGLMGCSVPSKTSTPTALPFTC